MKKFLAVIIMLLLLPVNAIAGQMIGLYITCEPKEGYFRIKPSVFNTISIQGPLELISAKYPKGEAYDYDPPNDRLIIAKCKIGKGIKFSIDYHLIGEKFVGMLDLWYGNELVIDNLDVVSAHNPYGNSVYDVEISNYFLRYSVLHNIYEPRYRECTDYGLNLKKRDLKIILKRVQELYKDKEMPREHYARMLKRYYDQYSESNPNENHICQKAIADRRDF